ncbi:unnamed protein product, partial [Darwinula stevensoni]
AKEIRKEMYEEEPYIPGWHRCGKFSITASLIFILLLLVLGAVFGVVVYRITIIAALNTCRIYEIKTHPRIFASFSAAIMNLIVIQFFNWGQLYSHPGEKEARQSFRYDPCGPVGCLLELSIQLFVFIVIKQIFQIMWGLIAPKLQRWWKMLVNRKCHQSISSLEENNALSPVSEEMVLHDEYLEKAIQFGLVTLFVAAFPLAPLVTLPTNIIKLRMEAKKFLCSKRRVIPKRAQDIGAWSDILSTVTNIAIVCNAFVIAFTTDIIPRLAYRIWYTSDLNLRGYINASLAVFNTSDFNKDFLSDEYINGTMPETCRFPGYRAPRASSNQNGPHNSFGVTEVFWHMIAARLAFVVIFEAETDSQRENRTNEMEEEIGATQIPAKVDPIIIKVNPPDLPGYIAVETSE